VSVGNASTEVFERNASIDVSQRNASKDVSDLNASKHEALKIEPQNVSARIAS
jgi:hypothetical protein